MFKIAALPQSGPWPTVDPFLFCVHHNDQYPAANEDMGPNASLTGRDIGQDFSNKDGWNMYHGSPIPGFPRHPHRGFETLTVVKRGLIDHSDSLGARARYGDGDAQWLTAGDGIVHAEMFPLLNRDSGNPMDFFQIWINLPASKKRVDPHFTMFWDMQIPRIEVQDENANTSKIKIVAGTYMDHEALQPPPNSWAAEPDSDLAVWVIQMDAQAEWKLPAAAATSLRSLYVVKGKGVSIDEQTIPVKHRIEFTTTDEVLIRNLGEETELLLLQGKPIREPVVQYGPFVMNTRQEIQDAFDDYSKTEFGGWRWTDGGPVHGRNSKKFAQLIDGTLDEPE
ncbi:MAG: pirin family protein [Candidatus Marinimicrobia bacterium]|nr:pirin family protein [Candidatus Neomarinimicrobiota bacterium]